MTKDIPEDICKKFLFAYYKEDNSKPDYLEYGSGAVSLIKNLIRWQLRRQLDSILNYMWKLIKLVHITALEIVVCCSMLLTNEVKANTMVDAWERTINNKKEIKINLKTH